MFNYIKEMKILHVAVFSPLSTNVWQADGFENLGCDVIRYDYRQKRKEFGTIKKRDNDLIQLCKSIKPNMILFSKCNEMDVRVITECNKIGTTVLWFMDNKWNINNELIQKFKKSQYIFCSRQDGLDIAVKYNKNVFRLQGGYNPKVHYPITTPKIRDVVFIGSARKDRKHYQSVYKFDILNNIYNKQHSQIVSETKINLSFTEGDGVSNRIYKLLAAGGFVLTTPWINIEDDFTIDKDIVIFNNELEFKEKIKYYLNHEDKRKQIALNGMDTVKQYDNNNYAKTIIIKTGFKI